MIRIGSTDWLKELRAMTDEYDRDFWSGFTRATEAELGWLEATIGRELPGQFKTFYLEVGYGRFPFSGEFDEPRVIATELPNPIFFVTGSMTPGKEWATRKAHEDL